MELLALWSSVYGDDGDGRCLCNEKRVEVCVVFIGLTRSHFIEIMRLYLLIEECIRQLCNYTLIVRLVVK